MKDSERIYKISVHPPSSEAWTAIRAFADSVQAEDQTRAYAALENFTGWLKEIPIEQGESILLEAKWARGRGLFLTDLRLTERQLDAQYEAGPPVLSISAGSATLEWQTHGGRFVRAGYGQTFEGGWILSHLEADFCRWDEEEEGETGSFRAAAVVLTRLTRLTGSATVRVLQGCEYVSGGVTFNLPEDAARLSEFTGRIPRNF